MLTTAPLPDWLALLKLPFQKLKSQGEIAEPWLAEGDIGGWLSRSAWSLVRIALWRMDLEGKQNIHIWFPDYFCNCSLELLKNSGCSLHFYPIKGNLQPDLAVCRQMLKENTPQLFVLVHFFGCVIPVSNVREFCRLHQIWFIEDAAHAPGPVPGIGENGDFVLYSPHKSLALPDGALLVARPEGPSLLGKNLPHLFGSPENWGAELVTDPRTSCLPIRGHFFPTLLWLLKRTIQKLGGFKSRANAPFQETFKANFKNSYLAPVISGLALRLLSNEINFNILMLQRNRNKRIWDTLLFDLLGEGVIKPAFREGQIFPYLVGYEISSNHLINSNTTIEAFYDRFKQAGIPVMTWPDLPIEIISDPEKHKLAYTLRHTHFFLPVHHSLKARDLIHCIPLRHNSCHTELLSNIQISWDVIPRPKWIELMNSNQPTNLLQSWDYGIAKERIEGWQVFRGFIQYNGVPLAIVQVLKRRIAGIFKVSRINRGPHFLTETTLPIRTAVFQLLTTELVRPALGQFFYFTPELEDTGENIIAMNDLGFLYRNVDSWNSIILDLQKPLDAIRKGFTSKWRNMLVYSEKQNLSIEICKDSSSLIWLCENVSDDLIKKGGKKVPEMVYKNFSSQSANNLIILKAFAEDVAVSAIGIVLHGSTATYLLGWNSDNGRQFKANYILLWHAIILLRDYDIKYFDLGGVTDKLLKISAFKLGLGGRKYSLIGDWAALYQKSYHEMRSLRLLRRTIVTYPIFLDLTMNFYTNNLQISSYKRSFVKSIFYILMKTKLLNVIFKYYGTPIRSDSSLYYKFQNEVHIILGKNLYPLFFPPSKDCSRLYSYIFDGFGSCVGFCKFAYSPIDISSLKWELEVNSRLSSLPNTIKQPVLIASKFTSDFAVAIFKPIPEGYFAKSLQWEDSVSVLARQIAGPLKPMSLSDCSWWKEFMDKSSNIKNFLDFLQIEPNAELLTCCAHGDLTENNIYVSNFDNSFYVIDWEYYCEHAPHMLDFVAFEVSKQASIINDYPERAITCIFRKALREPVVGINYDNLFSVKLSFCYLYVMGNSYIQRIVLGWLPHYKEIIDAIQR